MVSKSFVALVIFINAVPYKGPEAPPTFEIKAMDRTLNVSVIVVGTFLSNAILYSAIPRAMLLP